LKVLLNVDAITPELTGIGNYTWHLLANLVRSVEVENLLINANHRIQDGNAFWNKLNSKDDSTTASSGIIQLKNSGIIRLKNFLRKSYIAYAARDIIRNYFFRRQIHALANGYIYHEPNFILKPYAGVSVTTFHDLSCIHYPQYHPATRVKWFNNGLSRTLAQAQHILTDSEYVKTEIITTLGVPSDKVTAIALGVDARFRPYPQQDVEQTLSQYNLGYGQYILAVATLEPRKNLHGLVEAFTQLPVKLQNQYPLVLVGGLGWHSEALLAKLQNLESKGLVRRLGYISREHLPQIYAGARMFAFPSFYEGFGLPPLEAMASGVPVLTSANSAMAEVVADAGILVEPHDTDHMAKQLQRLLMDDALCLRLSEQGMARAKRYSWQACAEQTLQVYQSILEKN